MTSSYPFTMHIPVVIVMNVSHVSGCAIICMEGKCSGIPLIKRNRFAAVSPPFRERGTPGYNCQSAAGRAITGSRDNDTPVQSQAERKCPLGMKTSQLMRAAPGEPRRGAIPVELASSQSFGDFPVPYGTKSRGVGDK